MRDAIGRSCPARTAWLIWRLLSALDTTISGQRPTFSALAGPPTALFRTFALIKTLLPDIFVLNQRCPRVATFSDLAGSLTSLLSDISLLNAWVPDISNAKPTNHSRDRRHPFLSGLGAEYAVCWRGKHLRCKPSP